MDYTVRCPHCRAIVTKLDTQLWPGTFLDQPGGAEYPGDPSEPPRCDRCRKWMRIVLVGKHYDLTAERCDAPQADPPEILGTGL